MQYLSIRFATIIYPLHTDQNIFVSTWIGSREIKEKKLFLRKFDLTDHLRLSVQPANGVSDTLADLCASL